MTRIRRYSEWRRLGSFDERFEYLKLGGSVGHSTFGFDRYLNQRFYSSREWKQVREIVILRDEGCDLGVPGHEIHSDLLIHHVNPMSVEDIIHHNEDILDPEFLILTCKDTHNALHYGGLSPYPKVVPERRPGDTTLW